MINVSNEKDTQNLSIKHFTKPQNTSIKNLLKNFK